MQNGAYFYTQKPGGPRILVEVWADNISECGEEGWRPLSQYPGTFTRLIEVWQPLPTGIPATVAPRGVES